MKFQLFIHRRSSRKIAWRLKAFLEGWGSKSPISLLKENLSGKEVDSRSFPSIEIDPSNLIWMKLPRFKQASSRSVKWTCLFSKSGSQSYYLVDRTNLVEWITFLEIVVQQLTDVLVEQRDGSMSWTPKEDILNEQELTWLVFSLLLLWDLRPIVKHLFSLADVSFENHLLETSVFIFF